MDYSQSTYNNIKIIDSYQVKKKEFGKILKEIKDAGYGKDVFENRKLCSLKLEWAVHNFLYNVGYQRHRTADVDLEYPQELKYRLGYPIIGFLVWIFIK